MIDRFHLSDDSKQMIVNAVATSLSTDYPEHLLALDSPTNNSGPFAKWDVLNRRLVNSFQGTNIDIEIVHRGPWSFALLYDFDNKSIISLMRSDRFAQLADQKPKSPLHYLFSLAELNDNISEYPGQTTLFPMTTNDTLREKRHQIRERLLSMGEDNIAFYGLILFTEQNNIVSSVKYSVVNSNMDILHQESLNNYIKVGFSLPIAQHLDMPEQLNEITRPVLVRRKDKFDKDAK